MENLKTVSASRVADQLGPLVEDRAPCSGMGLHEFRELQRVIKHNFNCVPDPLPPSVADRPFWQYGNGEHSSGPRIILDL